MKRICAWCGKPMDGPSSGAPREEPISHGICHDCSRTLWAEVGIPIEEFLESLDLPTILVDGEGRVRRASAEALGMVAKDREDVEGFLGGEVFQCVNANLPGGCGQTELCSACTVRNTVTHTYRTGEAQVRVPATLDVTDKGSPREMAFHLTTRKVGSKVIVQIEPSS